MNTEKGNSGNKADKGKTIKLKKKKATSKVVKFSVR